MTEASQNPELSGAIRITTAPPTEKHLAAIRARRAAIGDAPWGCRGDLDGSQTVQAGAWITLDEGFASSGDVATVHGDTDEQRYRRGDFIAQAPYAIDLLHNEIDRLRAELATRPTRADVLREAEAALQELREKTDLNSGYDFRQRVALGDAVRSLRRMADGAEQDDSCLGCGLIDPAGVHDGACEIAANEGLPPFAASRGEG